MSDDAATPRIDLVYFEGCPHVDEARATLEGVLSSLGHPGGWREWDRDDEETPAWAKALPSPTILVAGEPVAGEGGPAEGPACAPGGAPAAEEIRRALADRGAG